MGKWYVPYYLGFFAWNYLQNSNYDGAYGTIPSEIMATEYAKEFEDWLNGMGLGGVDLCPCED